MIIATLLLAACQGDPVSLDAWKGGGGTMKAWSIADGVFRCDGTRKKGEAKWIHTKRTYSDYDLTLEFQATPDSNSGVFLRAPLKGNPANMGLEVQLFDNDGPTYSKKPRIVWTGSVWKVAPPTADVHKKAGEWQALRILCVGAYIGVWHNGRQVVSIRVDDYPELVKELPGLLRREGHIGLQNHGRPFYFRKVVIKPIKDAAAYPQAPFPDDGRTVVVPPEGFVTLFNGKDLAGWNLAGNAADHWTVKDGEIHYDGKGGSLASVGEFGDFILYVDWKIAAGGDSGIFPRGRPQVQIWDIDKHAVGSGGLWNNKKTHVGEKPLVPADRPVGKWNAFRIKVVGDKVTVHLNGKLVVDDAPMEMLKKAGKIIERGPVKLQHHGHPLWFRNIFIKELK